MSEQPGLKREGTMAVTAQEGEAFLESHGMKVSDDVAKTRGQKEKLDEITNEGAGSDGEAPPPGDDKPKVTREGTMQVTAKEGQALLGDKELEKTRAKTAVVKETEKTPPKPRLPRDSTMAVTAQEGKQLLEGEELEKTRAQTAAAAVSPKSPTTPTGRVKRSTTIAKTTEDSAHILGQDQRGRTRSQTRKFSESDDKKPAVKRTSTMEQTAKEGEEFLTRESKRPKADGDTDASGTEPTSAED